MKLRDDQESIRSMLTDTITLMCQNVLTFKSEANISALIGITLDKDEVCLVDIRKTLKSVEVSRGVATAEPDDGCGGESVTNIKPRQSVVRSTRKRRATTRARDSSGDESSSGEPKAKVFHWQEAEAETSSLDTAAIIPETMKVKSESESDGAGEVQDINQDTVNEFTSSSTSQLPQLATPQFQQDPSLTLGTTPARESEGSFDCTPDQQPKEERKSKYKRIRTFQESWRKQFYWLDHQDGLMFCRVCVCYEKVGTFVVGSSNFKIEALKIHEQSKIHKRNLLKWQFDNGAITGVDGAPQFTFRAWQQDSSNTLGAAGAGASTSQQCVTDPDMNCTALPDSVKYGTDNTEQTDRVEYGTVNKALPYNNEYQTVDEEQKLIQVKQEPDTDHLDFL